MVKVQQKKKQKAPYAPRTAPPPKLQMWKKFKDNEVTKEVRQYLTQLAAQASCAPELKADIPYIQIAGTRQLTVEKTGKEVIVCLVPQKSFVSVKRIHSRLLPELEKKSNKHLILLCQRQMLPSKTHLQQLKKQPLNQKLSTVIDGYMEDICGPCEVVGKRLRFKSDGKRVLKVLVDPKERTKCEDKLETYNAVHKDLLNREAIYKFPEQ